MMKSLLCYDVWLTTIIRCYGALLMILSMAASKVHARCDQKNISSGSPFASWDVQFGKCDGTRWEFYHKVINTVIMEVSTICKLPNGKFHNGISKSLCVIRYIPSLVLWKFKGLFVTLPRVWTIVLQCECVKANKKIEGWIDIQMLARETDRQTNLVSYSTSFILTSSNF